MPHSIIPVQRDTYPAVAAALLNTANVSQDPDRVFFAKIIAKSLDSRSISLLGLAEVDLQAMVQHFFPVLDPDASQYASALWDINTDILAVHHQWQRLVHAYMPAGLADSQPVFTGLVRDLLRTHCVTGLTASPWIIHTLAHACLRPDHLWRDLGLTGRTEVTELLMRHFPTLVALNIKNLRWKHFLSFAAYEQAGLPTRPAPGCPHCEDYEYCYFKA